MKSRLFPILSFLLVANIMYAQEYSFNDVPSWVKAVDPEINSEISKYDIVAGYYISVADYQANLETDEYFTHEIIDVTSFSGITNASQISVEYDTSYQELIIHHLYIIRNGKKIDRTQDLKFEILNQEESLEIGIYTGYITAYAILEDIRKDDRIDFAYTLTGANPIFEDEEYLLYPLQTMNPFDYLYIRLLFPEELDYSFGCVDCENYNISDTIIDSYQLVEVSATNTEPMELEDKMPSWLLPYSYFMLSSQDSWSDVHKWAAKVFALDNKPDLDAAYEEVFDGTESMNEKVNKLVNFIQDDIRYMGIESGIGSIKPFPPEQVLEQRFGDCKDKSLLLVELLKGIGIQNAYPALVSTSLQHEVESVLPGGAIFNHCIVTFDYMDTTYWIDPTATQQGGDFRNNCTYDYGKALIIGKISDSLQSMDCGEIRSTYHLYEEYEITSFHKPASLKVVSERQGAEADFRRAMLEYFSKNDISKITIEDHGRLFPVVEIANEMEVEDDIENNIIKNIYEYTVDGFWINGDETDEKSLNGYRLFVFQPLVVYDYMNVSSCNPRIHPIELQYPMNMEYFVTMRFPEDIIIDDAVNVYENEGFYFKEKIEQIDIRTFQVHYTLKNLKKELSPEEYAEICKQKKEIRNKLKLVVYFHTK